MGGGGTGLAGPLVSKLQGGEGKMKLIAQLHTGSDPDAHSQTDGHNTPEIMQN